MTLLVLGLVLALPVQAQDHPIRGQWDIRVPTSPDQTGTVLIDAAGRVTWDVLVDGKRLATRMFGYVARVDGPNILAKFTDRVNVVDMHCTIQSADLLHCYGIRDSGWVGPMFALVRTGPGPKALLSTNR